MDIFKIIGIGILGAVIVNLLRTTKSELSVFAAIGTGIIILLLLFTALTDVINVFNGIVEKTNISSALFSGVLKIVGVGYLTEYSANICNDCDCKSIADKIMLGGKITIFIMALPIINSLIDVVLKIIP